MSTFNRVLSIVVVIAILVIRFLEFKPISAFWGTLVVPVVPIGLAVICIWWGDEAEAWFGSLIGVPSWCYRAIGWFVLLLYLGIDFVRWRKIAP